MHRIENVSHCHCSNNTQGTTALVSMRQARGEQANHECKLRINKSMLMHANVFITYRPTLVLRSLASHFPRRKCVGTHFRLDTWNGRMYLATIYCVDLPYIRKNLQTIINSKCTCVMASDTSYSRKNENSFCRGH